MNEKKLNIFDSGFSIRADLKNKEKIWQEYWKKIQLTNQIQSRKSRKTVFLSGPPYANGDIHIGHALNKVLKDFVLRFSAFSGAAPEYKPGWDLHGLPIATEILKQKPNLASASKVDFRTACLEYALSQVEKQTTQFERLGLLVDFQNRYLSSDYKYIACQLKLLSRFVSEKRIERSLKPVFWSWSSQTALAETEIIYRDKTNNSLFFLFPVVSVADAKWKNTFFAAWTTAIWTIPENKLLAIDQTQEYLLVQADDKKIIISAAARNEYDFFKNMKILQKISGKELVGLRYAHCYLPQEGHVVHSSHVQQSAGTGVVHIAPAFGIDDFNLAKKAKMAFHVAINEKGVFNDYAADPDLTNVFYQSAESIIKNRLQKSGHLLREWKILHSYPFDWRTKKPVFYRATPQWYLINLPKQSQLIKKWEPKWGSDRINNSLKNRSEWCISRQRAWGVPIPAFRTTNNEVILSAELVDAVRDKIISARSDQIWWTSSLADLLPSALIKKYAIKERLYETMDVWFDSGVAAKFNYFDRHQKIDFIWEGNDQFRGWFSSLSILSGTNPQLGIGKALIHGFVNDENGFKMSKSKKNTINPNEVCAEHGADILRIWVANSDYYRDINFGPNIIRKTGQMYLKVRNTIRFLINNLVDFDVDKNFTPNLNDVDWLILHDFEEMKKSYTDKFTRQSFHSAWTELFKFINFHLSNFYFDYAKGFIYSCSPDTPDRRRVQTVFHILLPQLLVLLAPVIPHTTEEAYKFLQFPAKQKPLASIHLESWPKSIFSPTFANPKPTNYWKKYRLFLENLKINFSAILDQKKKSKEINRSQQMSVSLELDKSFSDLKLNTRFLAVFLKVHQMNKISFGTNPTDSIKFTNTEVIPGTICERCYSLIVNSAKTICSPCLNLIA